MSDAVVNLKSTHKAEVVPVELLPHENATSLSIVKVHTGYTVVVKTSDWKDRPVGVYIPPDSLVDVTREEFAWLGKVPEGMTGPFYHRVKVKKLRGVTSMGLLIPAPEDMVAGDDVTEVLGVLHYNPDDPGEDVAGPQVQPVDSVETPEGYFPKYDLESLRRYADAFIPGEPVWITEKVHGSNAKFVFIPGRGLYVGSRNWFKKNSPTDIYWRALRQHSKLSEFLTKYPLATVYGEVYGHQDLQYGLEPGQIKLAIFDILMGGQWLDPEYARDMGRDLPWVPLIGVNNFDLDKMLAYAEGPSLLPGADHIREGVVIRPMKERVHIECGRVCLKVVSNSYLERP